MPLKDPIARAEYKKKWAEANKERIKQKKAEKYIENKEHINRKNKENYEKYKKEQPEKLKKQKHINAWRNRGIIDDDLDALYDYYIEQTNCMICDIDFSISFRCLDHDHETGEVRYICCNKCNTSILRT